MKCKKKGCNSSKFNYTKRKFKNGTTHYQRNCKKCGAHNLYASEEEALGGGVIEATKETKESRLEWNQLLTNIFRFGGQEMVDDFIQEVNEMYRYEEKNIL